MRAYKSMDMPAKRHHEQMQTGDATGLDMPWHAYTNKNTHRFACYSMLALDLASHYCIVYSQLLQVHARTHARTHRLTYTLARTQADNTRTHARAACSRVQTHTHKHNTQARYAHRQPTHTDTHTHAHAHVLARAHTHTHSHSHTGHSEPQEDGSRHELAAENLLPQPASPLPVLPPQRDLLRHVTYVSLLQQHTCLSCCHILVSHAVSLSVASSIIPSS